MKLTLNIHLTLKGERLLKETNWLKDQPVLPTDMLFEINDLVKTGILYKSNDDSIQLTDVGEEVLLNLK